VDNREQGFSGKLKAISCGIDRNLRSLWLRYRFATPESQDRCS